MPPEKMWADMSLGRPHAPGRQFVAALFYKTNWGWEGGGCTGGAGALDMYKICLPNFLNPIAHFPMPLCTFWSHLIPYGRLGNAL